MSRGNRKNASDRAEAGRRRVFIAANTGWVTEQPDRRLIPGQVIQVPLDAASPFDGGATIRLRVRCRECSQVLGIVFDWSTADGEVSGRKLTVNGGHALVDDEAASYLFTFACCDWSAGRTGAELAAKTGNIQLP